jgi:TonB family protein
MRDTTTPLFLWVCAAICAHFLFAEGGGEVAREYEDRTAILRMVVGAREKLRLSEQTFEVGGLEVMPNPEPQPPPPAPPAKEPEAKKEKPPKPEEKKPEAVAKKEEEKKAVALVPEKAPKQTPPPELPSDKRIAVRQHAAKNQPDNPNAPFLADEANRVEEETVATQTAHDQDDPNPTPGGNHAGPKDHAGDSDRTRIAESEEHAGQKDRAPGEKGTEFQVQKEPPATKPMAAVAQPGPKEAQLPQTGGDGRVAQAPQMSVPQAAAGGAGPGAPDVAPNEAGTWSFNPVRPGAGMGPAPEAGPGSTSLSGKAGGKPSLAWLGLGGKPGPGQVNLNLTHSDVVAVVGTDQLRKEREADGERRRSEHRGSWQASSLERWRSAIENYVSTVKPGNQTALNTAQSPFASYLNGMHNRIHPIFADSFLSSLDSLPKTHPLNDNKLITTLEIVLTPEGRLFKMGIVRTSGVTAFDVAALDSVQRASPFGPAPNAIISNDGHVYLHWQFHRDEVYACSTMHARPYLLNLPPAPSPADPMPGPKGPVFRPGQERGLPSQGNPNESREGRRRMPPSPAARRSGTPA